MSETENKAPWHLWVVGLLSLLWNGFGAYDFLMTTTRGETYWRESGMTDPMVAYYNAMPGWMYLPWTLGVWCALAGSVLLLARRKWALHAFALSFVGAAVSSLYQFLLSDGLQALGPMAYMSLVILTICALLVGYARAMVKRGVLR